MMVNEGVFFSQLCKYKVRDVNNKKIGHVGDLLLNKDDWSLNSFIIHGSIIEETLEAMKLKDDIDPIVPKEFIDNEITVDKSILLTKPKHHLAKTFTGWKPKDKVHQFSKLKKLKVYDENNEDVGRVIDILFHSDGAKTLVISGSNLANLFDPFRIIHHNEILVPIKFITKITSEKINLSVSQNDLVKQNLISLYKLINKDLRSLSKGYTDISSRYYYFVYEADLKTIQQKLKHREKKISASLKELSIVEYDSSDLEKTKDFVTIFNDVALTSVDPYEEMTDDVIQQHFNKGSFIAYRFGKPVGYVILSFKEEESRKTAAIAGIGISQPARGKGFSTALMSYIIEWLRNNKEEYDILQADILASNRPSIGLFRSMGFKKVDDFYLC